MDLLDVFGKCLNDKSTGKRMPSIGYEIKSEDEVLLNHAYICGYRHFIFGPEYGQVIANARRLWSTQNRFLDDDIFLTLKMPVIADRYQGAQHTLLRVLSQLKTNKIDMVLLYNNDPTRSENGAWNSKWMELESLYNRGMVQNIGLISNKIEDIEQVNRRCRQQPHIITFTWNSKTDSSSSQLHSVKHYCTTHKVKLCIIIEIDTVPKNNCIEDHDTKSSKVICRSLMQNNLPYIISCSNPTTTEECFQVYGFAVAKDTANEVLSTIGLNNNKNSLIIAT